MQQRCLFPPVWVCRQHRQGQLQRRQIRQMMCRMQQKLRQRILRRMQLVTIWKVPFSIWMIRLRQTILMHSRMEIYRRIRRHSRMEMRHQTRRHRISTERLCKTRTAIMSQSRQVINRTLRLEQILMILKERRFFLLWALMRQICQIMMWSM